MSAGNPAGTGVQFLDNRLIATGDGWVAWWRPAKATTVFIKGKARRAWIPPMVFVGGKKRRAWVMRKSERPDLKTQLYLTGWSNTYQNGGICWGSGIVPATLDPTAWEEAFFASSFEADTNFKSKPHDVTKNKKFDTLGRSLEALARASD